MSGQELIDLSAEVDAVLKTAFPSNVSSEASSLIFWAALNLGAARLSVGLVDRLGIQGGYDELRKLVSDEPYDVMEAATISICARSVVTAMDLCAATLYRILGGPQLGHGGEADVGTWTPKLLKNLAPEATQAAWLKDLKISGEWKLLEQVRHGMTHRKFRRTIKITIGTERIPSADIHIGGTGYPIDSLVQRFYTFGDERFTDFCMGLKSVYT